ncbi:MAG: ABC transporter permease [Polyangia bacterium]|jgi:ABC-type multidrug transport system ATPase subunit/ABC-type transporter Mla maintaining outer membrane lipid asymmetry permease subunit MlaE|nr:ABC transporter permease [Polyangia bacterium]
MPDESLPAPLLDVKGLRFTLPGQRTPLFDGLDLTVGPGETVVIMGGSGTGKSMLASLLFRLRPGARVEGEISLALERSALLLQSGAVFEHLSLGGNLRLVLRRFKKPHGPEAVRQALGAVALDHHPPGRRVDSLSGGEQRRLALARALCADPRFLYFDEPSAGLDLDNVLRQGRLIRRVVRQGRKGAVVVTHDPLLTALVADRVLVLEGGRLAPLLAFEGAAEALDPAEEERRARRVEAAVAGRFEPRVMELGGSGKGAGRILGALSPLRIGDYALSGLRALFSMPGALRHPGDFLSLGWRGFSLAGLGGVPFFALIGFILGATFIMILLGASILPARITLEKVQAVPLTALAAPLVGFLFAARSGSAIASWLGGMTYSRQVDALKTLAIDPDKYLRSPVWLGMAAAYALSIAVFFGAMWVGAWVLCRVKVGIEDPTPFLRPFDNEQITAQALMKIPLYALVTATVTTHLGLQPKPTSESVARGITRVIIVSTVVVALTELIFAGLLAVGGGA